MAAQWSSTLKHKMKHLISAKNNLVGLFLMSVLEEGSLLPFFGFSPFGETFFLIQNEDIRIDGTEQIVMPKEAN